MNKVAFLFVTFFSVFSLAQSAYVVCKSEKNAPRYPGKTGQWTLRYELYAESEFLAKFHLNNSAKKDIGEFGLFMEPEKFSKTQNVYEISDYYCTYNVFLPVKISELVEESYSAKIEYFCKNGEKNHFDLLCQPH